MCKKLAEPTVSSFRKQTESIPLGPGYRASKVTPSKDFLQQGSTNKLPPKGSMTLSNSTTCWGLSVPTLEPMGHFIVKPLHKIYF